MDWIIAHASLVLTALAVTALLLISAFFSGWLAWAFLTPGSSSKARTTRGSQPAQVIP